MGTSPMDRWRGPDTLRRSDSAVIQRSAMKKPEVVVVAGHSRKRRCNKIQNPSHSRKRREGFTAEKIRIQLEKNVKCISLEQGHPKGG
eukprot:4553510-Amphidinium_carterae.1